MGINLINMGTVDITPTQHQRRGNMSLIFIKHPLEHRTCRNYSGLRPSRIHPQEIELGANNLSGLFGIGGGTSSAAKDVGGEVVDFFAVFVGYFCPSCGAGVCSEDYATFVG